MCIYSSTSASRNYVTNLWVYRHLATGPGIPKLKARDSEIRLLAFSTAKPGRSGEQELHSVEKCPTWTLPAGTPYGTYIHCLAAMSSLFAP